MGRLESRPLFDRRVAWPANRLGGPRGLSARLSLGRSRDGSALRVVGCSRRVKSESYISGPSDGER